ncbi:MAG: type III PLP-dependent enzyme [Phycicoccus sp.]|nr:type III PLP-dependent enzyme [Phycicoccus sp.]
MQTFLAAPRTASVATLGGSMPATLSRRQTPHLLLDPQAAVARYRELQAALPGTALHYAVKANPHPDLLAALAGIGSCFDVASPAEARAAIHAGAHPDRLLHSNPVAGRAALAESAALGVRRFVVDAPSEVTKLAEVAPGAAVLARLATTGAGSDWPLSRKFGCSPDDAITLLTNAARTGLVPYGLSFHVGSQQRDPAAWDEPIAAAARVTQSLRRRGIELAAVDLGGGFPAAHEGETPALSAYGHHIDAALTRHFGARRPVTLAEPGRGLVGDAGVLVAGVIAVLDRGGIRWVYLDAGIFTGLVETLDEAIRYRLTTTADGGPTGPCVLAGPTCDSADVLYERRPVHLPLALAEGDQVRFGSAGAYTSCYSTVGFNGFAPLPVVISHHGAA